ncbi:AAHS family 4-hydroxybenzoate transporter-like MFS transporter [Paraburkholderia sp. BL6669N2]|uniref:MFS transporter n=1 Tax=Paraburkholderia sp. BL6669N2 TaxID=1938807 RepID=UPI000E2720C8|nr:MFS transporter [Paraburkholderia sp. BL6669N2]REG49119.1 AAHS family 4-hydroxybenzoate transporter-like MFS transporter [Paraburkholderia sp. BL6669N2]
MSLASSQAEKVDIEEFIDRQKVSAFQWVILGLCFLIVAADGFDTAAAGFVAPAVAKDWGLTRLALGPLLSSALIGSVLGALISGPLADRIGRKRVLAVSVLVFGVFTLACAKADSLHVLTFLRLVSGIGLGAAMPNATTMVSEYMPKKHRALLVNVMFCGFTFGASAGGFAAAALIPAFGWESVFVVGGVVPVLLSFVLFAWLPESVRFMVANSWSAEKINLVLGRISGKVLVEQHFTIDEPVNQDERSPVALILSKQFRSGSLLLWVTYFMGLLVYYLLTNWLPTLMKDGGMSLQQASLITALFPLGGGLGAIVCGILMDRVNAHRVVALTYVLAGVFICCVGHSVGNTLLVGLLTFLAGSCMAGAQISMPVLAVAFYPTNGRASGVAWMLGIGRIGGIVGAFAGAVMLQAGFAIDTILQAMAVPVFVAAAALLVKNQLGKRRIDFDSIAQEPRPESN